MNFSHKKTILLPLLITSILCGSVMTIFTPVRAATTTPITATKVDVNLCKNRTDQPIYGLVEDQVAGQRYPFSLIQALRDHPSEWACFKLSGLSQSPLSMLTWKGETSNTFYILAKSSINNYSNVYYSFSRPSGVGTPLQDKVVYINNYNKSAPDSNTKYGVCGGLPQGWGCWYPDPRVEVFDYNYAIASFPEGISLDATCSAVYNPKFDPDDSNKILSTVDWATNVTGLGTNTTYKWSGAALGSTANVSSYPSGGKKASAQVEVATTHTDGTKQTVIAKCSLNVPNKPVLKLTCSGTAEQANTGNWTAVVNGIYDNAPVFTESIKVLWQDGQQGVDETVHYPPDANNKIFSAENSVKAILDHPDGTASAEAQCKVNICPQPKQFRKYNWEVTWFGGQEDIRIDGNHCAYLRNEDNDTFSIYKDKANPYYDRSLKCVKIPYGSVSGGGGYTETFNINKVFFRDAGPDALYAAYPVNSHLKGEFSSSKVPAECNRVLKNMCMRVIGHEGETPLDLPIWDRGSKKGMLDLSHGALRVLGLESGDHAYSAELVECDSSAINN